MVTKNIVKIASVFALTMVLAEPSFAAQTCQAPVTGTGEAKANTILARDRAKDNWSDNARNTYGTGYGSWLIAANKSFQCSITGSFPKTHTCTAIATPCKIKL